MDTDIICAVTLLFGLPNEKEDIFEQTIEYFLENELITHKLEVFPYVPIVYPGTVLWDRTPVENRCTDWEIFFVETENKFDSNKIDNIIYSNPTFKDEQLQYYVDNCAKILFEKSNLSAKDFIKRDLNTIIDEGFDAIESEMDEEWFKLSIKNVLDNYIQ